MFTVPLLAVALAAPMPKAKAAELYFPTVEGTKWVIQTDNGERTYDEAMETVTKVVEKDGKFTVTVTRPLGDGKTFDTDYEVSGKGVFHLSATPTKSGGPPSLIKLPAKQGDKWTEEYPEFRRSITSTVGKEEEVAVPAGKFQAIRVTQKCDKKGDEWTETTWYAPGVGVVKRVNEVGGGKWVRELKEFTTGKSK